MMSNNTKTLASGFITGGMLFVAIFFGLNYRGQNIYATIGLTEEVGEQTLQDNSLISDAVSSKPALQPKIKELQAKHADDKTALAAATMAIYTENKINPLSGCLPILIQLPFLIALYSAFSSAFQPDALNHLYSFVHNPGSINQISLGFIDLTKSSIPLAVVAGILQFVQVKLSMNKKSGQDKDDPAAAMSQQMLYIFPILLVIIAYKLPIGLVIYFIASSVFATIEQWYIRRKYTNI